MVVYAYMTALDLIGPQTFLAALGNIDVHLVWKIREPIASDNGLMLQPSMTFADCPSQLDIRAKYATSVCMRLATELGPLRQFILAHPIC